MIIKKVNIIEIDAFKYFSRINKKVDIIFSEPSNPWVTGIENLYTPEYYQLIKKSGNKVDVAMNQVAVDNFQIASSDIIRFRSVKNRVLKWIYYSLMLTYY